MFGCVRKTFLPNDVRESNLILLAFEHFKCFTLFQCHVTDEIFHLESGKPTQFPRRKGCNSVEVHFSSSVHYKNNYRKSDETGN